MPARCTPRTGRCLSAPSTDHRGVRGQAAGLWCARRQGGGGGVIQRRAKRSAVAGDGRVSGTAEGRSRGVPEPGTSSGTPAPSADGGHGADDLARGTMLVRAGDQ
ncbi:hypothetical protein GCM10022207_58290 [Streptomyces lannensis]|uniref:Uncharacterized protein n=1 Tax=Streptomyces lannensis TaxID=766498 RepID=A0ABP7KNB1_9ACTN